MLVTRGRVRPECGATAQEPREGAMSTSVPRQREPEQRRVLSRSVPKRQHRPRDALLAAFVSNTAVLASPSDAPKRFSASRGPAREQGRIRGLAREFPRPSFFAQLKAVSGLERGHGDHRCLVGIKKYFEMNHAPRMPPTRSPPTRTTATLVVVVPAPGRPHRRPATTSTFVFGTRRCCCARTRTRE